MSGPFPDHFSSVAKSYAHFRPQYPDALFEFLATLVSPRASVWDCACGNGQATQGLSRYFDKIIATDASAEQVASATSNPNVEYRVATAEQSGLAAASVDLITVAQALHWFDLELFYQEARRVLRPGGVLAAWAYGINQVEGDAVNALVEHYYSQTVGPYWPPERKLVEEGYRTIPFPFEEMAVPDFRMDTRWTLEELLGYFSTWSATNRYTKKTGSDPIEPLRAALLPEWGNPETKRLTRWPLAVRMGRL